ncbi:MAG: hypothetical protein IT324_11840 [Anaerolineae bacterium]|nr:hypothetical protein [Anaerolineae bacterium]
MTVERSTGGRFRRILDNLARAVVHMPAATLLIISGVLTAAIYTLAFTRRYSLAEFGSQPLQLTATLSRLAPEAALIYIGSFAALFGLYWIGLRWGLRPPTRSRWALVIGFGLIFNVLLLPMYPADAADVYDYVLRGRMATVHGLNPMRDTPLRVPQDPFFQFASFRDQPSAYGPLWEMLATAGSRIAGDDFTRNVIVFKLIAVIGYAVIAGLIALTLRILAPRRALTGVYLFMWNPLVVYLTGSGGHNDTVMMVFVMLSVYLLARRWYATSVVAAVAGALIKFIPILIVPIVAIMAWRQLSREQVIRQAILAAVASAAIVLLSYGPYWVGGQDIASNVSRRTQMYTGSFPTLARQWIAPLTDGIAGESAQTPKASSYVQYAALALLGVFYLFQLEAVWNDSTPFRAIRAITMTLAFHLLVTVTWFQPWYVIWLVALGALLDNTPLRRMIMLFSFFALWQPILYYFVTLRPGNWSPQPWRDLVPVAVVVGTSWLYVGWFWLSTWLRSAMRTPLAVSIGEQITHAREAAKLSVAELADELDLKTDDLLGYERGDRSMSLATARVLGQRLGLEMVVNGSQPTPSANGGNRQYQHEQERLRQHNGRAG